MIDLKETGKNPAYTLGAMLYGLQNPIETKDVRYELDMSTFGCVGDAVCYGCAATSTLEVITGRSLAKYVPPNKSAANYREFFAEESYGSSHYTSMGRARVFNTEKTENQYFENCINAAREGDFGGLMEFFDHEYDREYDDFNESDCNHRYNTDLCMSTKNWQDRVPAFEAVIDKMHKDYPQWERFKL